MHAEEVAVHILAINCRGHVSNLTKAPAFVVQVLLAVGTNIMTVDVDSAEQSGTGVGSIQQLCVAPNGQFVAAYTEDGRLKVWTSDFSKALSEFATQSEKPPEQLEWCGTDSVVMCWQVKH